MTIDLSNINKNLNSKKAPNIYKKTLPIKKIMDLTSNRTLKSNLKKNNSNAIRIQIKILINKLIIILLIIIL